ncbi:MAG TPA: NADH-ubiquinone oxidoreductase-F iron-sulfur binding region domain-containing protein [Streptosporangiaceae bacterium]
MSAGCARLLAGWHETGRAAGLRDHLDRYGPPPLATSRKGRHQLIEDLDRAGLTGRGGAAFPAGRKLRAVAAARGPAVVVANGMESEPASRKDQTLLALAPHLVLDGMALAAAAAGAQDAYICLPRSRPRQVQAIREAVEHRRRGQLDRVPVAVREPPARYVSSEETALVRWLNGGDARPASTPPRPFERGVSKRPTLVSNVETLAHLALIARYGPEWFRSAGTEDAPGTALVTLAGAFARPGVHEVGLGAAVRDVLALGSPAATPQAVLFGGYQGAWLPGGPALAARYSAPALQAAGAVPGPGLIMALADGSCGLAETARILAYLAEQSAGQCGPCRFGLPAVAGDFADLAWGRGPAHRLEQRISLLTGRGACHHPDGAARLAASALRAFSHDVRRHLTAGPCDAARSVPHTTRTAVPAGREGWR